MDVSAALTADEISPLSDPNRSCKESAQLFKAIGSANAQLRNESTFERSLRLKNTLDAVEVQARVVPTWQRLAILINCEYQLYAINQDTPLRLNPFLSHWVEAIQRLAEASAYIGGSKERAPLNDGAMQIREFNIARVETIKSLLKARASSSIAHLSPKQLHAGCLKSQKETQFDLKPYIQMLEEEGIYEPVEESSIQAVDNEQGSKESIGGSFIQAKLKAKQNWKQSLLARLEHEPQEAVSDLTHLPLELSSLDFLTTLVQDKTLQRLSIEPSLVVRDYLQHALRLAEQMGQPSETSTLDTTHTYGSAANGRYASGEDDIDHGRAAQTRAVKLLLLFIKNLIRKALIQPAEMYFEIQEICVRYVWIKEVRDFRAFIEEGEGAGDPFGIHADGKN